MLIRVGLLFTGAILLATGCGNDSARRLTVQDYGRIPLLTPVNYFDGSRVLFESADLELHVPAGVSSVTVYVEAASGAKEGKQVLFSLLKSPTEQIVFDAASATGSAEEWIEQTPGPVRQSLGFGTSVFLLPGAQDDLVKGGYVLRVSGTESEVRLYAVANRDGQTSGGILDINVFCVMGNGFSSADSAQLQNAVTRAYELLGPAGILPGTVQFIDLSGESARAEPSEWSDLEVLMRAAPQSAGLNVFLLKSLSKYSSISSIFGLTPMIPLPLGVPQAARGIFLVPGALPEQDRSRRLGETLAHEALHAMGLFHTTEESIAPGKVSWDIVSDTPECPAELYLKKGVRPADECRDLDGNNLMFGDAANRGTGLTTGQSRVVLRSPLLRPQQ